MSVLLILHVLVDLVHSELEVVHIWIVAKLVRHSANRRLAFLSDHGLIFLLRRAASGVNFQLHATAHVSFLFFCRFHLLFRTRAFLGGNISLDVDVGLSSICSLLLLCSGSSSRLLLRLLTLVDLLKDAILVVRSEIPVVVSSLLGVGHNDLVKEELSDDVRVNGVLLELKVVVVHGLALNDLVVVFRIVQLLEEGMLEDLLCRESLLGIIRQKLLHQIDGLLRSIGNEFFPGLSLDLILSLLHVGKVLRVLDLILDVGRWHAKHRDQEVKIVL